jgi:hypothetical protein
MTFGSEVSPCLVRCGAICGRCRHRKCSGAMRSTRLQLECVSTTRDPPTSYTHPLLPAPSVQEPRLRRSLLGRLWRRAMRLQGMRGDKSKQQRKDSRQEPENQGSRMLLARLPQGCLVIVGTPNWGGIKCSWLVPFLPPSQKRKEILQTDCLRARLGGVMGKTQS